MIKYICCQIIIWGGTMFGSKNKENLEKIESLSRELEHKDEVYGLIEDNAKMFEANAQEYEDSSEHMTDDLKQIAENLDASGAILSENGKLLNALHETLRVANEDKSQWKTKADAFIGRIDEIAENSQDAVENNKHFTGPSKALGDFTELLKHEYMDNMRDLKLMAEYSKQMSVLALNAAIEAGRMGESGQDFVVAAESVRNYATNYDNSVRELIERLGESQRKVAELEEQVHSMISLMKDNNIAVSKIMKDLNDLSKSGRELHKEAPIEMFEELLTTTGLLHDAESEVDRMEARNRMQMDDVLNEVELQKKNVDECKEVLLRAVELTREQ